MINLATNQSTIPILSRRNAFDLIMQNAIQLKLPNQKQPQVTRYDLLYNKIIILFEKKKLVGSVDYIFQQVKNVLKELQNFYGILIHILKNFQIVDVIYQIYSWNY